MAAIRNKGPINGYTNQMFGIDRNVLVSHEHAIQVAKIPKNASSFLRYLFLINHPAAAEYNANRETADAFHKRIRNKNIPTKKQAPVRKSGYMTCVVLRDPFSRMVSTYLDRVVNKIGTGARDEPKQRFYDGVSNSVGKVVTAQNITFHDFLTYALACPDYRRDKHYRTQVSFFRNYRVDLFSTTDDLTDLFYLMRKRSMTIPEQSHSHSKTTRYMPRDCAGFSEAGHLTAPQLKSRSAFPSPRAFYTERTVRMILSEYSSDIDNYCDVRNKHRDTLIQKYLGV